MEYLKNIFQGIRGNAVDDGGVESGALSHIPDETAALQVIGKDEIARAEGILQEYKRGKTNL